ncbi:MAG: hypothetical protein NTV92_00150, partial [Candidatus Bipolaricaulota bacterium]|nr:hypothetical protein [Candidatus Bipolaricaulota bacterium]
GRIPCACAHEMARACDVPTAAVGRAADSEGIRVTECQLGLFGYEAYGEKRWVQRLATIPRTLEEAIRASQAGERLPCAAAWRLADDRGLPRLLMGSVAETLNVRVSDCQLGCF